MKRRTGIIILIIVSLPIVALVGWVMASRNDLLYTMVMSNTYPMAVNVLLTCGADANTNSSIYGRTPLHEAAYTGNIEMAKLLIEHGAEINIADKDGKTPLHEAAGRGKLEVAKLLIEHGADVNATDRLSATPLRNAESCGDTKIAELLRQHGAKE